MRRCTRQMHAWSPAVLSPRGDYALLDDFTERVDTDISNNAGMLGVPGPPRTFGLYRDGNRIAALPKPGALDVGYAPAALDALPYQLIPHANVLLAGASGGFRIAEALALGAARVRVLEPEPVLLRALEQGLGPSPAWRADSRVSLSGEGPVAATRDGGSYDIIDLSADFLDAAEANATAFIGAGNCGRPAGACDPAGSCPSRCRSAISRSMRCACWRRRGRHCWRPASAIRRRIPWSIAPPGARASCCRTDAWDAGRIATLRQVLRRAFVRRVVVSGDRPGGRARQHLQRPAGGVVRQRRGDLRWPGRLHRRRGAARCWRTQPTPSRAAFNLAPITLDRPFFYAVLRLDQLDTILKRLEILPQAEIGALVNLAVLAQAVVIAAVVLLVPLAAPRRLRLPEVGLLRPIVYFPALGLGFLFIEIFLIEKASLWLNDRTSGFALVLTGMLVFSGLGSMIGATAWSVANAYALRIRGERCIQCSSSPVSSSWPGAPLRCWGCSRPFWRRSTSHGSLARCWSWPSWRRCRLRSASRSRSGLTRTGSGGFLPWAWGLNGAFSVVATPLANLIAREAGFSRVLLCAAVLYVIALVTFPAARKSRAWQHLSARSRAAE